MAATEARTLHKIIHPGSLSGEHYGGVRAVPIFCKIEWDGTRLSISGVEGPTPGGNARGGSGQIEMHYAHRNPADDDRRTTNPTTPAEIEFAPGWNADLWLDFLGVWHRWHLNDMRAGCEHIDPRVPGEERTIYHWRLDETSYKAVKAAIKEAELALRRGETARLPAAIAAVAQLPERVTTASDEPPGPLYEPNGPKYDGDTYNRVSEVKTRGWLRPEEHPDGLLGKACGECGYAYGSAWKTEAVPDDVIEFLAGLPSTGKQPAWV